MDNRDRNIRCPFYRPGSHSDKRKMRRIHCQGDMVRLSAEFKSAEERTAYAKRYCKQGCTNCSLYRAIESIET